MAVKKNNEVESINVPKNAIEDPKPVRRSRIRKSIVRKLNTAKFETMDIIVDHDIEVDWRDAKELLEKAKNVTALVLEDYKRTEGQVLSDLQLSSQNAFRNEADLPKKSVNLNDNFDSLS